MPPPATLNRVLMNTADILTRTQLLNMATKIFGNRSEANRWLKSPQFGLGGKVPLDLAKSEAGARKVENLLDRIKHGVYT